MPIDYTKRPNTPAGAGVSLSKVTLTKSTPTVSLAKKGTADGVLRVNLNWNTRPEAQAGGGFLKRIAAAAQQGIDLDLGCLWELSNGDKGVVQALGNAFQAFGPDDPRRPVIWLDGDDRTGAVTGGENLFVDLSQADSIRRVLVFAYIYQGTPNWAAANAKATLIPAVGPQIEVRLDEPDPGAPMCAIALLENRDGEIVVRREVRYVKGNQRTLDEAYHWGMKWAAGRK